MKSAGQQSKHSSIRAQRLVKPCPNVIGWMAFSDNLTLNVEVTIG
jgi:hypothetical protein